MKTLLIVYHTSTGGTRQMAEAAATAAATEACVDVRLVEAVHAGPDDVLAADGYLFAAPENLAALSGLIKDFFDRCYYPVLGQINGRPYGLMICAGSDGTNAARQAMRMRPVGVCGAWQSPLSSARMRRRLRPFSRRRS
jgi:multimeric flavodoxin WrbA